jgi:multidrug efflux pump subunit AcrA (membrane-fusion protein)
MKQRTFKAVAMSVSLFLVAALWACTPKQVAKPLVPVKVAAVEMSSAGRGTRYSATIIPRAQVELAFKVSGYVDALQQVRGVGRK